MLLRLVPAPPLPTVLFTLAFPNLPDGVPFPQNWSAQLQHVLQDDLEMPNCIHALDKSAGVACLLHEVSFCVFTRTVVCVFIDGSRSDWPLLDDRCVDALKEVLDEVNESTVAAEMEARRARVASMPPPTRPASPIPAKLSKHKKSRSLLMTIVASFVPSSQPSSPILPAFESPVQITLPPEPRRSSRFLRRKARAALVDIYRRYIIPELGGGSGSSGGGYCCLDHAEHVAPDRGPHAYARAGRVSPSALAESPFEDDEESNSSSSATTETDTDASSVHTPRDSYAEYPGIMCRDASCSDDALVNAENGIVAASAASSKQQQHGSLAEYNHLHASTVRLHALLHRSACAEASTAADRAAHLALLEAKSKRRAWSSHTLLGRACIDQAALSTPTRSSPLARCAVLTPETLLDRRGVPRTPGGRLAVRRLGLGTIEEREDALRADAGDECFGGSGGGGIPFPLTEPDGDDFCSTGPQDPLPLFGHPAEADDAEDVFAAETYAPAAFDPSSERGCGEFTLALDLETYDDACASPRRRFDNDADWLAGPVVDCR
ncbi:hypothetical protein DFH11DRAFT_1728193 [Phellopilus nigrolimitatus]|nr:hypothetical protein DFH11DRAFT_1728193 [Phellopilus nigrolimitatus]